MAIQLGTRAFSCIVALGSLPFLAVACGTEAVPSTFDPSPAPGANQGAAPSPIDEPSLGVGGTASGGATDGGGLGDGATCAESAQAATQTPVDLVFMVDSSLSMEFKTAAGATKWSAVRDALVKFAGDARSAGLGVQLQYFPLQRPEVPATCTANAQCSAVSAGACMRKTCSVASGGRAVFCDSDTDCAAGRCVDAGICLGGTQVCTPGSRCAGGEECVPFPSQCSDGLSCGDEPASVYAKPAVAYQTLPAGRAAFAASLTARKPWGGTPTRPALEGALAQAQALATARPDHKVVTVLVTDGMPTLCGPQEDVGPSAAVAEAAFKSATPIATYVMGVFDPKERAKAEVNLDRIARAGGTSKAFVVGTNQDVAEAFAAELGRIRNSLLGCDYDLPKGDGREVDYAKVSVKVATGGGEKSLGRVSGAGQCAADEAFYFDVDPAAAAPGKVHLCPRVCEGVKADPAAKVDIVLGCRDVTILR